MPIPARVSLTTVPGEILSCYPIGAKRSALKPLAALAAGRATPDTVAALVALHNAVLDAGGDFRVTELFRPREVQVAARTKYDRWVAAGKPSPSSPAFNPNTMKAAFVARPGFSNHEAGRAIDVDLASLKFPNVTADKQLDRLWELARPLGWRPIIKAPTEGASESWHFDYLGEWAPVYDRLGDYAAAAMCGCLDLGIEGYGNDAARAIQANLQRAGYDIGEIDGVVGAKTERALAAAGLGAKCRHLEAVMALPSSGIPIRI